MKTYFLLFCIIFLSKEIYCQSWEYSFPGNPASIGRFGIETFDGNYVVTGTNGSTNVGLTLKLDSLGNIIWSDSLGGYCVQQTFDSGFIVAGVIFSFASDGYLLKLDSKGSIIWTRNYGNTFYQEEFHHVEQTNDSGFIACGFNTSSNSGDAWLVKTNLLGDTVWTKRYGGPHFDEASEVEQTFDGGFIFTGRKGTNPFGDPELYVVKTDFNGNVVWSKTYSNFFFGESIRQTTDGGYIIAADYGNIIKLNATGDIIWSVNFPSNDGFNSVRQTNDGGYIAAGYVFNASGDIFLQKICPSGEPLWSSTFTPSSNYDAAESVVQTSDNGFLLCGYKSFSSSPIEMYVIKTENNDTGCFGQDWAPKGATWHYEQDDFSPPFWDDYIKFTAVGDTTINGDSVTIIREEKVSLSGTTTDYIYMKYDSNRVYYYHAPVNEFRLLYDFNAEKDDTIRVFCRQSGSDSSITIIVDSTSMTTINGHLLKVQHVVQPNFEFCRMQGTIIKRIGWTGFMFPQHSWADPPYGGQIRCYEDTVIGLYEPWNRRCDYTISINEINQSQNQISIFPIPTSGKFQIQGSENVTDIFLFNSLGKLIQDYEIVEAIDISELKNGMYFIAIIDDQGNRVTRKIIKTASNKK